MIAVASNWSTSASTSRPPTCWDSTPPTSPPAGRYPGPRTTSTPRASRASWPARRPIPARPCCAPEPPWPPPLAWSATREALAPQVLSHWPEVIAAPSAERSGPGAGLGGRARPRHRRRRGCRAVVRAGDRPAGDRRRRRADHPRRAPRSGRRPRCADRVDPARRRIRATRRFAARRRPRRRHPQAGRPARRHRAAEGQRHGHRRTRRTGLPQPGGPILGGHRGIGRRAVGHHRRAAGRRAARR